MSDIEPPDQFDGIFDLHKQDYTELHDTQERII